MEIKESYKERLSESGDNSRLIVMIRANWMTLEFSNALLLLVCVCVCYMSLYERACECVLQDSYIHTKADISFAIFRYILKHVGEIKT